MRSPTSAIPQALSRGVFGWDPVRLCDAYTNAELALAIQQIHDDPASANPEHARGSIHLYTAAARKRTTALAWAVVYNQQSIARAKP